MLRLGILVANLLLSVMFSAQEIKKNVAVEEYYKKVDSIVSSEKKKLNVELDSVEAIHSQGKISKEQLFQYKKEISEKYATSINEKLNAEEKIFKDLTKTMAVNSIFTHQEDTIKSTPNTGISGMSIRIEKKKEYNPKKDLNTSLFRMNYALLNLTESGSINPFESDSQMKIGNSHSFEIMSLKQKQLGNTQSPFLIRYGISYRADTYMPKKPFVVGQGNEGEVYLEEFTKGRLKRSKLRSTYFTIPVEFYWVVNPKYMDYNGKSYLDLRKNPFKIGLGAYAGIHLRSIAKIKYYEPDGSFEKEKFTLNDGVNRFVFGLKFSVHYADFEFFIKKDITPTFNDRMQLPYKNAIHLGINIGNIIL